MRNLYFVAVIFCLFYVQQISGQNNSPSSAAPKVIPSSPEASNLGKYADLPVSLYTGTPNISIPIYEINVGTLKLPVSLSYHASGIKVEEMASWVGLGWALNAGGVITRTVRGKPDDTGTLGGFLEFSQGKTFESVLQLSPNQREVIFADIKDGCVDSEPDLFFLNINGITAKFMFDWGGVLIIDSDRNIDIRPIFDVNGINPRKILGWLVKDEVGNNYKLNMIETTQNFSLGQFGCNRAEFFGSTWYLTEMYDINEDNKIIFEYDDYTLEYGLRDNVTIKHFLTGDPTCGGSVSGQIIESLSRLQVEGKRIKKIKTSTGNVEVLFNPSIEDRADNDGLWVNGLNSNYKYLDEIIVKKNQQEIKKYKLTYRNNIPTKERLMLLSIREQNNGQSLPPTTFSYSEGYFPPTMSKSQDHWGYYNGKSNTLMIPGQWITQSFSGAFYASGADREPDINYMQNGILKKITYPTGGYNEMVYEPNEYGFIQSQPFSEYNKINTTAYVGMNSSEATPQLRFKTTQFTITAKPNNESEKIPVTIHYWASVGRDAATMNTKPWIKILDASGNVILYQIFGHEGILEGQQIYDVTEQRLLPAGTYTLQAAAIFYNPPDIYAASIDVSFENWTNTPYYKKSIGGLRIKEMMTSDGNGTMQSIQYLYNFNNDVSKSSGVIYEQPKYSYEVNNYCLVECSTGSNPSYCDLQAKYLIRSSNSTIILGNTQNSHVGYREVQVIYGKNNKLNGKSLMKYYSPYEFPDGIYYELPFRPPVTHSFKTGLLKEQTDYEYRNNEYYPLKKTENTYQFTSKSVNAFRVMFLGGARGNGTFLYKYLEGRYENLLGHSKLLSTKETLFDKNVTSVSSSSEYTYDSELHKLKVQKSEKSDGRKFVVESYYPEDYINPSSLITTMKSLHFVGLPLETITKITDNSDEKIISGLFNKYEYSNGKLRQTELLRLNTITPIISNQFSFSINNNGLNDGKYVRETQVFYDVLGNIQQFTTKDNLPVTYLWGYNSTYPIAEVKNATYQDLVNVLGQTVINQLSGASPGTDAQVRQLLAPLRTDNRLKDAMVTTYTYKPLVGMTSATDANGITIYYEYDSFQRLKYIKDQDGKILKEYKYHYKEQPD